MCKIARAVLGALCCYVVLAACGFLATPEPTATPVPTATPTLTATLTATPEPSNTPVPSPTRTPTPRPAATATEFVLSTPSDPPLASWNGLLVMPQAIAGEDNGDAYSYIVAASVEEVQRYYETAMPGLGWQLLATGAGETGNVFLIFQKEGETATVGIIGQGDVTYVMLVTV